MYKRSNQGWIKHIDFIIWDEVALQLAYVIAYMIRHGLEIPYLIPVYGTLALVFAIVDLLISAVFNTMHNVLTRGFFKEFAQSVKQALLVLAGMSIFMFSSQTGDIYSRVMVYLTAILHVAIGYIFRLMWKPLVFALGKGYKRKKSMILVTDEAHVKEVVERHSEAERFVYSGLVLTDRNATGEEICGIRVVADLKNAAVYICREWVDEVFVYPSQLTEIDIKRTELSENVEGFIDDSLQSFVKKDYRKGITEEIQGSDLGLFIEQCRQMSVPLHICLPMSNIGGKSFIEKVGGYRVITTTDNYASPIQLAVKRLMDIVGALIGSFITLFIILIIGPRIKKESPGPILFKQVRIGRNGKRFTCYKLRSMYMDAEERKRELQEQNKMQDGMMFKMDFDPRIIGNKIVDGKQVTGIGEYIRRTSLDEFPQFFNVLFNQMSLVGTRPPTEDEWEKYKYHHRARLSTKPGLTGLWQVSGRSGITDFEEVVRLDTEYIQNWSIGLDIRILLKTIKVVLKKDGAM
ncbi:MAG: sugar transferase [Lachnospiraceae bacterium]|nr:sugar transferase [Lachnospiraceae bacterium]